MLNVIVYIQLNNQVKLCTILITFKYFENTAKYKFMCGDVLSKNVM